MKNIAFLTSVLKCSSKMLKFIECTKWITIIVTILLSGIFSFRILSENKEMIPKIKRLFTR